MAEENFDEIQGSGKETKREKFHRIATKRVQNTANQIRLIGNLSARVNYDYTAEDVKKIFEYLRHCLDEAEGKFSAKKEESDSFSF